MKSAKQMFDGIKEQLGDALALELVKGLIAKGEAADDLEGGGNTASAMVADLIAKGLDEETARAAVAKMVEAGKVVDDIDLAKGDIDLDAIEAAIDELNKGSEEFEPEITELELFDDPDDLNKGDNSAAVAMAFAQNCDAVVKSSFADRKASVGALATYGRTVMEIAKSQNATAARMAALEKSVGEKLDNIAKALGAPLPPRLLSGLRPVAHTGEPVEKGGDVIEKRDRLAALIEAELQKGNDAPREGRLAAGMSELVSGANPDVVARDLNLAL